MERLRAQFAQDSNLYPELAKARLGSKNSPLTIFDSDDEDATPPRASGSGSNPLQVRPNQGTGLIKTSNSEMKASFAAPVPRPLEKPVYKPSPAVVAAPPPPPPMQPQQQAETFDLNNVAYDPLERRKTVDETQKELMDLVQSSMGDDVEVDMEQATVEGFADDIKLLPHQVQSRVWMTERESGKKAGGILGDDMGLGKTCQVLARILDYKYGDSENKKKDRQKWGKSTLVVCPAGLVPQWESEIRRMAPALRVRDHTGPKRTKDANDFARYDVVVTSYPTLAAEHKNWGQADAEAKKKAEEEDSDDSDGIIAATRRTKAKSGARKMNALFQKPWLRIILDEAHNIKTRTTLAAKACYALQSLYKWCLTGTPIQNNVEELFSLIHFLKIRPLNDWDTFNSQIAKPIKAGRSSVPMKRLQLVLSAIMLRRTKTQIVNGKPILSLPDRTVSIVDCDFDEAELDFYTALVERTEATLSKYEKSGKLSNSLTSVLILLLRLRQACCHPDLCTKSAKVEVEAINPQVKDNTKDETEDAADDLAGLLGKLDVNTKEVKCEICQEVLEPRSTSQYCEECNIKVMEKARRRSLPAKEAELTSQSSSAKIRTMLQLLEKIEEDSEGKDKTIVFSQFTSFLDIIEKFLRKEGFKFVRYDGSMKIEDRSAALEKFKTNPKYTIAMISFKAGSTGLNLTAANHVILMDLWWNPALEDQAFDRAHRFGQTKDVFIHKLVVPKTVEERIQELQSKKRELATNALIGHKLGKNAGLRMDELIALFSHHHDG